MVAETLSAGFDKQGKKVEPLAGDRRAREPENECSPSPFLIESGQKGSTVALGTGSGREFLGTSMGDKYADQ